ncbi:hypothetical protein [Alienimonas californiensis]|uniref:Uncharacterized protein n=1 Tax=Alienimonas californiensis TaxID=2527989 RepID=A0A517PAR5_9PLAN|nr:hypothetical protein [Alienimonas californiensis]QDT16467.1 hypothetical protein CA12_25710 [Alienimonas californiensis]
MSRGRFAAHVRRRRGLWIAGGVLAVLLVPYVTAFVCLRRYRTVDFLYFPPKSGTRQQVVSGSYRLHSFAGGWDVAPKLYEAFIPIHQWLLGGMTTEEYYTLSPAERAEEPQDMWVRYDPNH